MQLTEAQIVAQQSDPNDYDYTDYNDVMYGGAPDECDVHWPKKPAECGCKDYDKAMTRWEMSPDYMEGTP